MQFRQALKLYLSSIFIYSIGLFIIYFTDYYQTAISPLARQIILYLFLFYVIFAPVCYFFSDVRTNKPLLILQYFNRTIKAVKNIIIDRIINRKVNTKINTDIKTKQKLEIWPTKEEKVAFLFMGVKLFFLPTLINFLVDNWKILLSQSLKNWYPFVLTLMFTIDTLIFSFGYSFESNKLNNTVKSVEPTLLGWFVTLICYPPFNSMAGKYIPWGADDYAQFGNPLITLILQITVVILLTIFTLASIALGAKASNLTNRGIVIKFPYSIVRHPAYASKTLIWWLTLIPAINLKFALGMLFWTVIYYFRATTEERHLSQDKDYLEYKNKVKYKFIPYVF